MEGTLAILDARDNGRVPANRRFLLEKTQHLIGGFAKHPGGPPDVYHAYLGLAALATMGEAALKDFDPELCISSETVGKMVAGRKGLLEGGHEIEMDKKRLDMGLKLLGRDVGWLPAPS